MKIMVFIRYRVAILPQEDEPAIEFARRCQRSIARRGGLVDLGWDGNLKRAMIPERLKREQRELFFNYLAETTSIGDVGNKTVCRRWTTVTPIIG